MINEQPSPPINPPPEPEEQPSPGQVDPEGVPVGTPVVPEGWRLVDGKLFWDPSGPTYRALLPYKVNHREDDPGAA